MAKSARNGCWSGVILLWIEASFEGVSLRVRSLHPLLSLVFVPLVRYARNNALTRIWLWGNREEIEAYVNEGVITHTGLAFSRDTDKKVYIQHKMNEDAELLATMLEDGVVRFSFHFLDSSFSDRILDVER